MDTDNDAFGIPEAPQDREATLRAKALAAVAAEASDEELLEKFKAEAREQRNAVLREEAIEQTGGGEGVGDLSAQGFPNKYHKLQIFKGSDKKDLSYVPISVNGYAIKVPRGRVVILPSVFTDTLNNAVTEVTTKSEGGYETEPAHRFPFQLIGEATEAEYKAFLAAERKSGNLVVNA